MALHSGPHGLKLEGFNPTDGTTSTIGIEYKDGFPLQSEIPAGTNDFAITQVTATPNWTYQVAPTTGSEYIVEVLWFSAVVVTGSLAIGQRIEADSAGTAMSNRSGIDSAVSLTASDVFAVVRFKSGEVVTKTSA